MLIHSIDGRPIQKLGLGSYEAGSHQCVWDGTTQEEIQASSGVYFYRMLVDDRLIQIRKLILAK